MIQGGFGALAGAVLAAVPPAPARGPARRPSPLEQAVSRDRAPQPQRQPRRRRARLQRLGLRPQRHARRPRPGAGQPAFPVDRHQPLLGDAPHHPRQARRDGRHHRHCARRRDRLQQGRGLDAHGLHRQALHAVRAEARPGRPDGLHRRRPAPEDDGEDRRPARDGRRRAGAEDASTAPSGARSSGCRAPGSAGPPPPPTRCATPTRRTCARPRAGCRWPLARNVGELRAAMGNQGMPWVNTIAADREGNALYADLSVVPDVLGRHAEALRALAAWRRAAQRRRPGGARRLALGLRLAPRRRPPPCPASTPPERMPVVVTPDWVQNSNDSFWLTQPAHRAARRHLAAGRLRRHAAAAAHAQRHPWKSRRGWPAATACRATGWARPSCAA